MAAKMVVYSVILMADELADWSEIELGRMMDNKRMPQTQR
jgi:hypothetical protein